eukprot:TRINITY_DN1326_c0_g1_i11.p1 TRINITY_DN1326_c0_g1~~TRINITY_DN1326_c0_g1_i11.p1  ORF type:complete len:114 (-),score=17.63 TRINITY_DN1326_c0_g1_i11:12-353(-)
MDLIFPVCVRLVADPSGLFVQPRCKQAASRTKLLLSKVEAQLHHPVVAAASWFLLCGDMAAGGGAEDEAAARIRSLRALPLEFFLGSPLPRAETQKFEKAQHPPPASVFFETF